MINPRADKPVFHGNSRNRHIQSYMNSDEFIRIGCVLFNFKINNN